MGGFAWVTLATNDSYSLGALVLAHSLKQVGTKEQLAVLVTPGVTSAMREKLASVFNVVQEVNILDSRDEANLRLLKRPELGVTFTKLHCWRLVQFDKCVFLDADTLVLQNCDELFEREELSAAPDVGWPDCFNSGVFVYRPSKDTYEKLVQFALDKGSFDGGDQGLLNLYFSDWVSKDISKHLPFIYNLCSTASYSYLPAFKQFGGNAKIVHFIGASKPWLQYFNTETRKVQPTTELRHLEVILQHWWNIFCSLIHPNLSSEMGGLAGAFAQLTLGAPRTAEQTALDDHLRRQGWEVGNIDYMGRDSFDNIWSKICETLGTDPKVPESSPTSIEEKPIEPASEVVSPPAPEVIPEPSAPVPVPSIPAPEPSVPVPVPTVPVPTVPEPSVPVPVPTVPEPSVPVPVPTVPVPVPTVPVPEPIVPTPEPQAVAPESSSIQCPLQPKPQAPEEAPQCPLVGKSQEVAPPEIAPAAEVAPQTKPVEVPTLQPDSEIPKVDPQLQPAAEVAASVVQLAPQAAEALKPSPEALSPEPVLEKPTLESVPVIPEVTKAAAEVEQPVIEPSTVTQAVSEVQVPASEPAPVVEPPQAITKAPTTATEAPTLVPEPITALPQPVSEEIAAPIVEAAQVVPQPSQAVPEPAPVVETVKAKAPKAPAKPVSKASKAATETEPVKPVPKASKAAPETEPVKPVVPETEPVKSVSKAAAAPESSKPAAAEASKPKTAKETEASPSSTSPTPPPRKSGGGVKKTKTKK